MWQPTPVLLHGESHGLRSLGATIHRVAKSDTTEVTEHTTHAQAKRQTEEYFLGSYILYSLCHNCPALPLGSKASVNTAYVDEHDCVPIKPDLNFSLRFALHIVFLCHKMLFFF